MGMAHQAVQARQGQLQKGHLVRGGAARQDEDRLALPEAEASPLAGPQADAMVDLAPSQLVQDAGGQVALARRGAPAGETASLPSSAA